MSLIKHISTPAELNELLSRKKNTLTVIDFFAEWCGPCHMIAPYLEQLSKSHLGVAFAKVDVDKAPTIAEKYGVKAMPTFVFIKNESVVDTVVGADKNKLLEIVKKYGSLSTMEGGSTTGDSVISLLEYVDRQQLNCLNEANDHGIKGILGQGVVNNSTSYLESDTDEQLVINIPFNQAVRIKELLIRTTSTELPHAPKRIKLAVNNPNLGFEDLQSAKEPQVAQIIELTERQAAGEDKVELRFVRFQAVTNLTIFVENNQGGEDETRINAINVFGWPGQLSRVDQLKAKE